jgi:hypothetical protein
LSRRPINRPSLLFQPLLNQNKNRKFAASLLLKAAEIPSNFICSCRQTRNSLSLTVSLTVRSSTKKNRTKEINGKLSNSPLSRYSFSFFFFLFLFLIQFSKNFINKKLIPKYKVFQDLGTL